MHGKTLLAAALLLTATATADDIRFAPGVTVQASVRLVADANGVLQIDRSAPITIGVVTDVPPVEPDDPEIPTPDGTLTEVVATATAAVPEYALKDQHQRGLAFSLGFLSQAIPNDANPSTEARALMKQAGDSTLGNDAPKWSAWWTAVDAKTAPLTNSQYRAAIPEIADGLTGGIAAGGPGDFGVAEYGLGEGFLAELFKLLLPFLLQMLTQLFNT